MDLAEAFTKHCVQWALDHCMEDLTFLAERSLDKGLIEAVRLLFPESFDRITYTGGDRDLTKAIEGGRTFEFPVYWGADLRASHERYLVEEYFHNPVIMTDYPKEIKAFYRSKRRWQDGTGMDVLFPAIGEIIGGSERRRLPQAKTHAEAMGIPEKDIWWYLDTRRFGIWLGFTPALGWASSGCYSLSQV